MSIALGLLEARLIELRGRSDQHKRSAKSAWDQFEDATGKLAAAERDITAVEVEIAGLMYREAMEGPR